MYPLGIINHINNCFISCALQILLNFPDLNEEFLNTVESKNWGQLKSGLIEWTAFYLMIYKRLKRSQGSIGKSTNIHHFYSFLCKDVVQRGRQGDYHEFFLQLSDRLSAAQKSLGITTTFDDLITGRLTKNIKCPRCESVSKANDTFSSVPITDSSNLLQNLIAMQESFELDDYNCDKCQARAKADVSIDIEVLPRLLVFHCLQKMSLRVPYDLEMGIKIQNAGESYNYHIYATVHHYGSQFGGHYFLQIFKDGKIYLINDEMVRELQTPQNQNIVSYYFLNMEDTNSTSKGEAL